MKKHASRFFLLLLALSSLSLASCASSSKKPAEDEDKDKVSTLPWSQPEKWEKGNPMGGGGATY